MNADTTHPLGDAGDTEPGDLVERLKLSANNLRDIGTVNADTCDEAARACDDAINELDQLKRDMAHQSQVYHDNQWQQLKAAESSLAAEKQRREDAEHDAVRLHSEKMDAIDARLAAEQRADDAETMASKEAGGWFNERKAREAAEQRVAALEGEATLFSAQIEWLEKALAATEQPLEHASQCLDGIVSMDDEDQGKNGGSATCQAVKKTIDRALQQVRAALRPAETGVPK